MASRITLGLLARATRRMKLPSTEVGKTAGGTMLVLNVLSCLLESTWGCGAGNYIHKFGEGERCLGRDVNIVVLTICVCMCVWCAIESVPTPGNPMNDFYNVLYSIAMLSSCRLMPMASFMESVIPYVSFFSC